MSIIRKSIIFFTACFAAGIIQLNAQEERLQVQKVDLKSEKIEDCYVTVSVKYDQKKALQPAEEILIEV